MSSFFILDNVFRSNIINSFKKEYNITDENYFNTEKLDSTKIFTILKYYCKDNEYFNEQFRNFNFKNNFCSLIEILYKIKFNINDLIIYIIDLFDENNKIEHNIIYYLIKISKTGVGDLIVNILENCIEKTNIQYFEKIIKTLYIQYKPEILNILKNLLQELTYNFNDEFIIFIKIIIDNISKSEFIDMIEDETCIIFNLIVEYHYDTEFLKHIIDKNVPKYLLFNSIKDSIIYMGDEYLVKYSFNNEIKQTIRDNINNNINNEKSNILTVYENNENQTELNEKIDELNEEFDNYYTILLYIYNKLDFDDKKDIINTIDDTYFIEYIKFCCIEDKKYINLIESENKEFNWRKKSPLLLVWYFDDKSQKRKFNEKKITELPFDMIREIISFI